MTSFPSLMVGALKLLNVGDALATFTVTVDEAVV